MEKNFINNKNISSSDSKKTIYIKDIITCLNKFWSLQGSSLIPAYNSEIGAATLHPMSINQCINNENFSIHYLQTCHRPGDNCGINELSKLCQHNQFQVLISPFPKNIRTLYIKSLEYIGIDIKNSDIKFLEDNWENPSIGAHGIGWEINMNGLEISQFTYMLQIGGINCKSCPVEIAYGIERIALLMQKKKSISELEWAKGVKYSEMYGQQEKELTYYAESNYDSEKLYKEINEKIKHINCFIKNNKPMLTYRLCSECNHLINLLDSKMKIGYYERTRLILQTRGITKKTCKSLSEAMQNNPL